MNQEHLPKDRRSTPLQQSGAGIQSVYLAQVSRAFAQMLAEFIGLEAKELVAGSGERPVGAERASARGIDEWEEHLHQEILAAPIPETERAALVRARVGQGCLSRKCCLWRGLPGPERSAWTNTPASA